MKIRKYTDLGICGIQTRLKENIHPTASYYSFEHLITDLKNELGETVYNTIQVEKVKEAIWTLEYPIHIQNRMRETIQAKCRIKTFGKTEFLNTIK